jgi:hypothetical protein
VNGRRLAVVGLVTCLLLASGCGDDTPVKHEPVPYNIYATANAYFDGVKTSVVYIYDADSLNLIDSIPLPNVGEWAHVSPDGRSLYITMWRYKERPSNRYIAKVDITSGNIVCTQTAKGASEFSPFNLVDDGRLIVHGDLLLDAETGAVVREHDYVAENH